MKETLLMMSARLSAIELLDSSSPSLKDYFDLLKPRVMSLVIFTSLCGLISALGTTFTNGANSLHPLIAFIALLSIAVGAGGAGCLNMWYEADIDAKMKRTQNRPIPRGVVAPDTALAFGVILSCGSVFFMAVCVNYLSAALLAFTIFFYLVVYTVFLKPLTPQNIVIGGLAGALPPLIGWTSVTGAIDTPPLIMVLVIFLWTVPHFWSLALVKGDDYDRAGIPMMPNVQGAHHTKKQIVLYAIATALSPFLLCYIGFSTPLFAVVSGVLGALFVFYSLNVMWREKGGEMRLFAYSILYLFLLFLTLVIDQKF